MTDLDLTKISEVQLVYHRKIKASDRPKIKQSEDAYALFRENWNSQTINLFEEFKVMLVDRNLRCMGVSTVAMGGITGLYVDNKIIFGLALKARACNLMLAHNHPSGNPTPSKADIRLTERICKAAQLLDITILDHIILTDEGFTSFASDGLIP